MNHEYFDLCGGLHMTTKKAIAAGHICIDITPVFPQTTVRVSSLGDLLRPGKLLRMETSDIHTGGSAANTGLAMKILGADVKILGKIGRDELGGMVRSLLDDYGTGDDLIEIPGETTSHTIVIAVPGFDRLFLYCPGANETFLLDDIPEEALTDTSLFHFGYPTLMRSMYENDGKELVRLFQSVRERGIATSLDLAAVDPSSDAAKADWRGILLKVLPYVDFFVPSFEELCWMLFPERYRELEDLAGDDDITNYLDLHTDIRPLAEECIQMGARAALIKCGEPGMYLLTTENMAETAALLDLKNEEWSGFSAFEKSYRIERVISATGAGDAGIAAFLASILQGCGPKKALEHAAAAGALCCTAYDAVSGLRPLPEIRAMIDGGWEKR